MKGVSREAGHEIVIALVGQPNVGKSTIFNLLTGLTQRVGNWPGKTVERRQGMHVRDGVRLHIVDLPGTYSLTANSDEERIARNFIIEERPDVAVLVTNAAALERNLYLLAELLILPVPVVLALNMMDVAAREGLRIDPHVLEAALGLPVVPLVASRNEGVAELIAAAERLARTPQAFHPSRPEIAAPHREVLARVAALLDGQVPPPRARDWVALKLLEGDAEITQWARAALAPPIWGAVAALLAQHEDAVLDLSGGRYEWIGRMVAAAVRHPRLGQVSLTDRIDRIAVHPLWGLVLLAAVFGAGFWLTFSAALPLQQWLEASVLAPLERAAAAALAGAPGWVASLIVHGMLGGAGLVATFVPVLTVFFVVLGLLEDTGYLARAAYVMDRFMHGLGLHGKSVLPLFIGFGCNVPAVMGARVIESSSGRLLTILLAPLVPCSARLAVLALLTPLFFGRYAFVVAAGLVALNLLVLALVGMALNRTLFRGQHAAFIMELPFYQRPSARTITLFVWHNVLHFLRRAGTVIVLVSTVVWTLASSPGSAPDASYLAQFGRWLAPLGQTMGLDWRMLAALVGSFVAKENAIAVLGILYGTGYGTGVSTVLAARVAPAEALSFLAATMLFIPCAATISVMRQETGGWRWPLFSAVLLLAIAIVAAALLYQLCRISSLGMAHA